MYLRLGNEHLVRKSEVLAVFDLDNSSQSIQTRNFLRASEKRGELINAALAELPKSFVLCCDRAGNTRVYLSQFNSSTLLRRAAASGVVD